MPGPGSTGRNLYRFGPVYQLEPKLGSEPGRVYELLPKISSRLGFLRVRTSGQSENRIPICNPTKDALK